MYKDKAKQREANRQASQRQRDKKGMTDDCAKAGIVIPDHPVPVIPERTAQGNIRVSKPSDLDYVPQCETTKVFEAGFDRIIRDVIAKAESHVDASDISVVKAIHKNIRKRGRDIKVFEDLPPDVQNTIDGLSVDENGEIDRTVKAYRTAIAIHYQHLFPDRYNSTGVV